MKFKKLIKACLVSVTAIVSMMGSSCGGGASNNLQFWVYGSESELSTFTKMTNTFNDTYGKEHNIKVTISSKPVGSYNTAVRAAANTKSGPDVFLQIEDNFKKDVNSGLNCEITDELNAVTDIDVSDIFPIMVNRLKYNKENNTSNDDDPIYGLPVNTKPTVLYYNETLFEKAGIITISVDEENLDKWNKGEIADKRGKYKSDYPKLNGYDIPKKGYYRSENPYIGYGSWRLPSDDEVLVFNNRIAMNWDEVEDLGRLFTPKISDAKGDRVLEGYNPEAANWGVDYGYFTEWWFNYGWSVGGDCLTDLNYEGEWNFSLLDPTSNYIVKEGKTFTGLYTGKVYKENETIEFADKMALPKGEVAIPDGVGSYNYDEKPLGVRDEVVEAAEKGILNELPSTREAFNRYLKLGASQSALIDNDGGIDIAPNPNLFTQRSAVNYFFSGKIAMLVSYSVYMPQIAQYMEHNGYKWDVAPLVVYKQYENPSNPDDDTIKAMGNEAGHSNSTAMVVRSASTKKEQAAAFIKWMASKEGQAIRVKDGWFPNQASLVDQIEFPNKDAATNYHVFSEALAYQGAGDWWYMPDYEWINVWAVPLNSYVRNGTMGYNEWYLNAVPATNAKLKGY